MICKKGFDYITVLRNVSIDFVIVEADLEKLSVFTTHLPKIGILFVNNLSICEKKENISFIEMVISLFLVLTLISATSKIHVAFEHFTPTERYTFLPLEAITA